MKKIPSTALVLYFITVGLLQSHPVSMSEAWVTVSENKVHVRFQILAEDYMLYYRLVADRESNIPLGPLQNAIEKHRDFLLKDFSVLNLAGERIEGKLIRTEVPELPAGGIPVEKLMDVVVVYHLDYPIPSAPEYLSFQQRFGQDIGMIIASTKLTVQREGFLSEPMVTLSNQGPPRSFAFDWNEVKPSPETLAADKKQRSETREKDQMGITSYDAVYAFIYIEDTEVRVEILIPMASLESWQPLKRKDPLFLEVEEQHAARPALEQLFCNKNIIKIDGVMVKPTLQQLGFYGLEFKDFALRAQEQRVSALTARVGAILSYSAKGAPDEVNIEWQLFNTHVMFAHTAVYAGDRTLQQAFTPFRTVFKWRNPGRPLLPEITEIPAPRKRSRLRSLVAPAPIADEDAIAIFASLHKNIYRAFDYSKESDIYDALARSVQGELLADLYLQIHKGLQMQEQGGAVSRIREVKLEKTEPLAGATPDQFRIRSTWTVEGTIEHWGHIHTRVNQYTAEFNAKVVDHAWKITRMNVINQERLSFDFTLRRF